jgi:hypothetical protein
MVILQPEKGADVVTFSTGQTPLGYGSSIDLNGLLQRPQLVT